VPRAIERQSTAGLCGLGANTPFRFLCYAGLPREARNPMAALPVTNTSRLVVDYSWRGTPYKTLFRFGGSVDAVAAIEAIDTLHGVMWDYFEANAAVTGTGVWYPSGDTVSSPVELTPQPAGSAGSTHDSNPNALQWEFLGRSADGRRVSWYWQGLAQDTNQRQRSLASFWASVAAIKAALEDAVTAGLCTISGEAPLLKGYCNQVVNDYLTHRTRRA